MGDFLIRIWEWLKQNSVYVVLTLATILGLVFIGVGMHFDDSVVKEWHHFKFYPRSSFMGLGEFLLISVVLGFVTNTSTFESVLKKSMEKVLYGNAFLGCRRDIREIWRKVSKQVYDNKFPDIAQDFLDRVESFFPKDKDDVSYYNDYRRSIHIAWEDEDADIIRVNEHISFELMTDGSKNEIDYTLWNSMSTSKPCEQTMIVWVDGKEREIEQKSEKNGNEIETKAVIKLKDSEKYKIEYKTERKYNLFEDHFIGFKAKYILKGLFVTVDCLPSNLHVQFINRGIKDKFQDDVSTDTKRIVKRYQGIVLPQEGYVISIYRTR